MWCVYADSNCRLAADTRIVRMHTSPLAPQALSSVLTAHYLPRMPEGFRLVCRTHSQQPERTLSVTPPFATKISPTSCLTLPLPRTQGARTLPASSRSDTELRSNVSVSNGITSLSRSAAPMLAPKVDSRTLSVWYSRTRKRTEPWLNSPPTSITSHARMTALN
jgi:hypothetical protein